MAKNKTPKVSLPSEQIENVFFSFIDELHVAGSNAGWETKHCNFDSESKESVEKYIVKYAQILKKVNEKFSTLLDKKVEIFGE